MCCDGRIRGGEGGEGKEARGYGMPQAYRRLEESVRAVVDVNVTVRTPGSKARSVLIKRKALDCRRHPLDEATPVHAHLETTRPRGGHCPKT